MTAGWHAPARPARSGVADHAFALGQGLQQHVTLLPDASVADRHVYHMGNNALHRSIHDRALAIPDVLVLHDAVLMHFYLGIGCEQRFVDEFVFNYGSWYEDLARDLWIRRAASAADEAFFRYPMLRRLTEPARAVVVHNPAAARMVRQHAPNARVEEIPLLFEPSVPVSLGDKAEWRDRHGLKSSSYLFGVFGFLRESKRLMQTLRAFEHVPNATLLIAGEFASADLERAVAPYITGNPRIIREGYLSESQFHLLTDVVDCGINLRFPSAGESSGVAVRLMGLGKPVIVTEGDEVSGFPDATCLPIPSGLAEEATLSEAMRWLVMYPGQGRAIGSRAEWHVQHEHSLPAVAARYREVLGA